MKRIVSLITIIVLLRIYTINADFFQEEHWDWDKIAYLDVEYPKNFLWGTSESDAQTEGAKSANDIIRPNSWTIWEAQEALKDGVWQPRIPKDQRMDDSCQRWKHYKEDAQLLKQLGMKAHRISIEWSKIEPEQGIFDADAMQHYIDYAQELLNNGILPIPTLFHHILPPWAFWRNSSDKSGRKSGFEDQQTIHDFVTYACYVLTAFKEAGLLEKMKIWITLNEPVAQPMAAYVYNLLPPGKKFNFKRAGIAAKNMLDAHIATYSAFKEIDPTLVVGITHIMQPIQPYRPWNPLDQIPAKIFNYLVNDVALTYLKTGYFNWLWLVRDNNPDAINKIDFIGINYYTHTLISMFKERARPSEKISDAYEGKKIKTIYAEGLYYSLKKAAKLGVPILITENGFAGDNFELRDEYIKKHLYVIYKALQEGIDIRGYLFWTLTDCFGWTSAYHSPHGIFKVNFETQERTFRPNAGYLIDTINNKISATYEIEHLNDHFQ